MLDIVVAETSMAGGRPYRGALPEWNEADIVDSACFEDASFYSDEASFYAANDTRRCPAPAPADDDDDGNDDALEEYLNDFFDEVSRSDLDNPSRDDASPYTYNDNDDDTPYFNDYSSIEIDEAYLSEADTDADLDSDSEDPTTDAVSAYLDLIFEF